MHYKDMLFAIWIMKQKSFCILTKILRDASVDHVIFEKKNPCSLGGLVYKVQWIRKKYIAALK